MNRYLLTSPSFEGSITYGYNAEGWLCAFEVAAKLTDAQFKGFLKSLENAFKETWFLEWAKHYRYRVVQLQDDISFERAWEEYRMKRDKDRAELIWNKMSDEEKQLFFASIKPYLRYCARNGDWYNQQLLKTYLKQRQWTSDWDNM